MNVSMAPDPQLLAYQETLIYPELPLAVYREVAAHLRQVNGVTTELLPQTATEFDYAQSQVGGLRFSHPAALSEQEKQQLEAIINFYAQRYGQPERH